MKVEIIDSPARVPDVDNLRRAARCLADMARDGNGRIARANHQIRPWRLDLAARR